MINLTLKFCCVWFIFIFLLFVDGSYHNNSRYEMTLEFHTVKPGETLWDIACGIYDKGKHRDVREIMFDISIDNYITNGEIYPGEVLKIYYLKERK